MRNDDGDVAASVPVRAGDGAGAAVPGARGKDDTLFAKCDGHLVFTRGVKRRIHVRPLEAEEAEEIGRAHV